MALCSFCQCVSDGLAFSVRGTPHDIVASLGHGYTLLFENEYFMLIRASDGDITHIDTYHKQTDGSDKWNWTCRWLLGSKAEMDRLREALAQCR